MLQRIQSVYLFLAAVLLGLSLFLPLSVLEIGDYIVSYKARGFYQDATPIFNTWGVLAFFVLSAVISFISIFLYKNRKLQVRLCNINIGVIVLSYITFGVYLNAGLDRVDGTFLGLDYGIVFPALAIISLVLAITSIKKDERLVRSLDRIR